MDSDVLFIWIRGFGSEGHRELVWDIALISELYKLKYIESDLLDKDREKIPQIFADNLFLGNSSRDIMKNLIEETDLTQEDVEKIARTEAVRIKNLAQWYIYKNKGFKHFKVNYTKKACNKCVSKYKNKVFNIDDIEDLPPVHDLCMCVAIFLP